MAPLLVLPAAFAAFLSGAHLAPWVAGAAVAITDVDGVEVDLDKLCRATDPLLDALADRYTSARLLADITRAADRVCAIAAAGPGVATDIRLIAAALQAIAAARAELWIAPSAAVDAAAPAHAGR
ncbi:MAG TPA: hypothetical protein VII20_05010 [Roseiarcus sp.]|jgi:hypothetical protein